MTTVRTFAALAIAPWTLLLAGCGNWVGDTEHVGRVGVTVDDSGSPVVLVAPCREGRARVTISLSRTEGMDPGQENQEVGVWAAGSASDQPSELSLADPGKGWDGESVGPPAPGESWILGGTFIDDEETVLTGPFFSAGQFADLTPDQVLVSDGERARAIDRESFDGDCG